MNASPSGRDKRQYERIRVTSHKKIWNLSEGGAYIATERPKRLGAKIQIEFRLRENGPVFQSLAQVVRVLHKPNPKIGEPAGMAVRFLDLPEDQLMLLREFLEQCKGPPDLF